MLTQVGKIASQRPLVKIKGVKGCGLWSRSYQVTFSTLQAFVLPHWKFCVLACVLKGLGSCGPSGTGRNCTPLFFHTASHQAIRTHNFPWVWAGGVCTVICPQEGLCVCVHQREGSLKLLLLGVPWSTIHGGCPQGML